MSEIKLPPLPSPSPLREHHSDYSAGEMQAYALAAIEADRKRRCEPVGEWVKAEFGNYPALVWRQGYVAQIGAKLYTAPQPQARGEPVAWRVHPFDYGIGVEGAYAITQLETMRDSWETKGWNIEPLYLAPQPPQIPEGYKIVPIEPTVRMLQAAYNAVESEGVVTTTWLRNAIYSAMLEAAPQVKP